jgi:DNA repair protein RadC
MKIKDIPAKNRPRERMKNQGINVLSDSEVLALIIQKGTMKENVVDMCHRLLSKYNLEELSSLSLKEFQSIYGMGEVKAMQILAAFEINKRLKTFKGRKVSSPEEVFAHFKARFEGIKQENFIILLLDSKNRIIKETTVFMGTLDSTLIHPREIFKIAIKESAASIILVHNHPSGDPAPSKEDLKITNVLSESGDMLNIKVLDHVIIGKDSFWSWKNS